MRFVSTKRLSRIHLWPSCALWDRKQKQSNFQHGMTTAICTDKLQSARKTLSKSSEHLPPSKTSACRFATVKFLACLEQTAPERQPRSRCSADCWTRRAERLNWRAQREISDQKVCASASGTCPRNFPC